MVLTHYLEVAVTAVRVAVTVALLLPKGRRGSHVSLAQTYVCPSLAEYCICTSKAQGFLSALESIDRSLYLISLKQTLGEVFLIWQKRSPGR